MQQIKALTGHRTDSAVAHYMDRSNVQRDLANEAVSVGLRGKRSAEEAEMYEEPRRIKPRIMQHPVSSSSSSYQPLQPATGPSVGLDFSHAVINAPLYIDLNSSSVRDRRSAAKENKENEEVGFDSNMDTAK